MVHKDLMVGRNSALGGSQKYVATNKDFNLKALTIFSHLMV